MGRASLRLAPIFQRKTWNGPNGRSLALLIYLKPVCRVCSPSETFAAETLSASRRLWAKDRSPSLSCIECWLSKSVIAQMHLVEDGRGGNPRRYQCHSNRRDRPIARTI